MVNQRNRSISLSSALQPLGALCSSSAFSPQKKSGNGGRWLALT